MNYTSWKFWLLFSVVFAVYWRLSRRGQNQLLLVASYVFYGSWDYRFLYLVLLSTAVDYIGGLGVAGVRVPARRLWALTGLLVVSALLLCSNVAYAALFDALRERDVHRAIEALPRRPLDFSVAVGTLAACLAYASLLPRLYAAPDPVRRKAFLTISMVANLAILGFFKYFDFFFEGLQSLLTVLGVGRLPIGMLNVLLPAGISFYTFQAMSYTIDIYRGETEPTTNLADFSLFICFFPHLVAGPIMRAHTLLPQVVDRRAVMPGVWEEGLWLVAIGLFKKLVVADNAALLANAIFLPFRNDSSMVSVGVTGPEALLGVYAFAIQIYADFSGYSAIARGISKWLGYELVVNFHQPYLAVSPSDLWRRWHISLSTWLRDYLYIPLGGSRGGSFLTYRNLIITMLLGGLWHGAAWTFVAWGLYHGFILCAFRALRIPDQFDLTKPTSIVVWVVRVFVMFHLTCIGWLLFRADSFGAFRKMAGLILTNHSLTPFALTSCAFLAFHAIPLFMIEARTDGECRLDRIIRAHWLVKTSLLLYLLTMVLIFRAGVTSEFIYFQF
jgi:D-alanyl-lipoteichoic acid acyltransferase DltB (MBOAT superfamily)